MAANNRAIADNPAGLISIAAVQSQKRSYVFYSEPNGNLCYLKSQVEEEASATAADVPPYVMENIMVKNQVMAANTESPQIAAVSYSLNDHDEIRVYYISNQGELQELCQTDGGSWTAGSIKNLEAKPSVKSLLTASVDYTNKGELKVYFNRDNDSVMRCAWCTLGRQAWSQRKIT